MKKATSVISAIAAALSAGEAGAYLDGTTPSAPDVVSTTAVRASLEASEVIEGNLRTIDYSACIQTAQATSPYSRYQQYRRYKNRGSGPQAEDKAFAKFPDHHDKGPGAFSNFSMPDSRMQDRINPAIRQQQMQRLRNMQQNRLKNQPTDVQVAFDLFKES